MAKMSDALIEMEETGTDKYGLKTLNVCSHCARKLEDEFELEDRVCKFCWRKGRKVSAFNF